MLGESHLCSPYWVLFVWLRVVHHAKATLWFAAYNWQHAVFSPWKVSSPISTFWQCRDVLPLEQKRSKHWSPLNPGKLVSTSAYLFNLWNLCKLSTYMFIHMILRACFTPLREFTGLHSETSSIITYKSYKNILDKTFKALMELQMTWSVCNMSTLHPGSGSSITCNPRGSTTVWQYKVSHSSEKLKQGINSLVEL